MGSGVKKTATQALLRGVYSSSCCWWEGLGEKYQELEKGKGERVEEKEKGSRRYG